MLFFKKSNNNYEEVLKTLKDLQLKYSNIDVKIQELESKIDFFKAELKQQRKKRLKLDDEDKELDESKELNNPVILPFNGAFK